MPMLGPRAAAAQECIDGPALEGASCPRKGPSVHPVRLERTSGSSICAWPEKLTEPLRWKKPKRIFVNRMSDLFQNGVEREGAVARGGWYFRQNFDTFRRSAG
jgi:hypothetical protein